MAELKKCIGVFMPSASQDRDGSVEIDLGAKGVVELELVSSGEKWGRGPKHDVHSSLEATVDSPTWHLVQALNTLIGPDGHTPAVTGFFDKVKPLTPAQVQMIKAVAARRSEAMMKQQLGVEPLGRRQVRSTTPWSHSNRSPPSTSKVWSPDTPARAARRCCRIAPWPRSTCGSCPT